MMKTTFILAALVALVAGNAVPNVPPCWGGSAAGRNAIPNLPAWQVPGK